MHVSQCFSKTSMVRGDTEIQYYYQHKLQQLSAQYNICALWLYHVSAGDNLGTECNCDLHLCSFYVLSHDWIL